MKSSIMTISTVAILAMSSVTVFSQENEKAAKARKELAAAKENLTEAKIDSAADFAHFKKEAEADISENQKKIAELKTKGQSLTEELKKSYDSQVTKLETKNEKLQKQLDASIHTKTSKWAAFKMEFKQDLQDVTTSIKNITVKNQR